nr:coiled-coil domain-containing protein 61 [Pelodiscus sinensis]|eukprot:XP_025043187.1 coiled-coil domain-containing protein 61 [Pelodiscus sinensis]
MAKLQGLQADYVFRGTEHVVRMTVNGSVLEVEVEDRLTTDQWRGEFDAAFIEDLTHKTGNFKQFGIFCSMLESALSQRAVTLDLLTYTDLEALRSRKIGVGPRHMPSASKSSLLSSKRYLILIYSVEFDRIHYPLPLPYVGKPDPVALQKVIRELKEELAVLKARPGRDFRDAEIRRLRDELSRVLEEKQEVETALLRLQAELKLCSKSSAGKEVNILKKIVQSLEEELLKERTKHQRLASKRLQENRQLADELAEVKASERSLRVRVKSLTNELALYKKGRLTPTGPSPQNRSASSRGFSHAAPSRSEGKVEPSGRSPAQVTGPTLGLSPAERSPNEGRSRVTCGGVGLLVSPFPGVRPPRFDPTAFVKAKERKQKEAELKKGQPVVESFRSRRSSASSGSEAEDCSEPVPLSWGRRRAARGRKPLSASTWNGPSGLHGVLPPEGELLRQAGQVPGTRVLLLSPKRLLPQHLPSAYPDLGAPLRLATSPRMLRTGLQGGFHSCGRDALGPGCSGDGGLARRAGRVWQGPANACSSPPPENLYDEPSADLSEIDARLQALQEYMNNLDTRT